jgi:hypothetical protein
MLERLLPHILLLGHEDPRLTINPGLHVAPADQVGDLNEEVVLSPSERFGHASDGDGGERGEVGEKSAGADHVVEGVKMRGEVRIELLTGLRGEEGSELRLRGK